MKTKLLYLVLLLLLTNGCAHTHPVDSPWGSAATASPGWATVRRAAANAATDPYTWVPALTAAALQIGNADKDFSENVRRNKPLFGSAKTAADVSDALRFTTIGIYAVLGLAAPGPQDASAWRQTKAQGLLTGGVALGTTMGLTDGLKSLTGRTRPNGEDDSLPSGHVSTTAAAARLAADTLDYYDMSHGAKIAADAGLLALTATTAWARIEAGKHFSSDVLLGAALGNFLAKFTTNAFLHPLTGELTTLNVEPVPDGGILTLFMSY